jgi:hypothetical protein
VKIKVDEITPKMGIDFKCSSSWLQQFKERWNITWQAFIGEGVSVDVDLAEK